MKKIILLLSMLLSICLLTGCIKIDLQTGKDIVDNQIVEDAVDDLEKLEEELKKLEEDLKDMENLDEKIEEKKEEEKNDENIIKDNTLSFGDKARFGNEKNPIKFGEAGKISALSYTSENDVLGIKALRIKEKLSKAEAAQIAEEYNETAFVKYILEDNVEWRGLLMEMDLKDFPIKYESGLSAQSAAVSLTPTDIEHNGLSYFYLPAFTQEKIEDQRVHQGDVFEYYFIYQMPKGFDDEHLLKAFNYKNEENQYTYFLVD